MTYNIDLEYIFWQSCCSGLAFNNEISDSHGSQRINPPDFSFNANIKLTFLILNEVSTEEKDFSDPLIFNLKTETLQQLRGFPRVGV